MYKYYNKSNNGCPVCGSTKGKCRTNGLWVICQTDPGSTNNYKRIKDDHSGSGAGAYLATIDLRSNKSDNGRLIRRVKEVKAKAPTPLLTGQERASSALKRCQAYESITKQFPLSTHHREYLLSRGVKNLDSYFTIPAKETFSRELPQQLPLSWLPIAGVQYDGSTQSLYISESCAAIALPIKDVNGALVGYQYRPDVTDQGKYKHLYIKDSRFRKNEYDENPLPIHNPKRLDSPIIICEGVLKSQILADRYQVTVIGSTGVNWLSSGKTLRNSLLEIGARSRQILIAPDAGVRLNPQVFKKYCELGRALRSWSLDFRYLDYGQLCLTDKAGSDPDEISNLLCSEKIDLAAFIDTKKEVLAASLKQLYRVPIAPPITQQHQISRLPDLDRSEILFNPDNDYSFSDFAGKKISFAEEDRDALVALLYKQGHKIILDSSDCGTGKSTYYANLDLSKIGINKKKIFFSPSPNKAPISILATEAYKRLPTRSLTNCFESERIKKIRDSNLSTNVCKGCPRRQSCAKPTNTDFPIDGEGYLAELAALRGYDQFLGNIQSATPTLMQNLNNPFIYIDEAEQQLMPIRTVSVAYSDIQKLYFFLDRDCMDTPSAFFYSEDAIEQQKLTEVKGKLIELRKAIEHLLQKASSEKYGFDHTNVLSGLGDLAKYPFEGIPFSFYQEQIKYALYATKLLFRDDDVTLWLADFLAILTGSAKGSFRITSGKKPRLEIRIENERLNTLLQADFLVFGDATSSAPKIAQMFSLPASQIVQIEQRITDQAHLEFIQLKGVFKSAGFQRSPQTIEQVAKLKTYLRSSLINQDIGFIEAKKYAAEGDLIHLSTARGSNLFEKKQVIVIMGLPVRNRGGILAEYQALYSDYCSLENPSEAFIAYEGDLIASELHQSISRLRANRRGLETLYVYLVTDTKLSYPDINQIHVGALDLDLMRPMDLNEMVILKAISSLVNNKSHITQRAIAKASNTSQSTVNRFMKRFGGIQVFLDSFFNCDQYDTSDVVLNEQEKEFLDTQIKRLDDFEFGHHSPHVPFKLFELICDKLSQITLDYLCKQLKPKVKSQVLASLFFTEGCLRGDYLLQDFIDIVYDRKETELDFWQKPYNNLDYRQQFSFRTVLSETLTRVLGQLGVERTTETIDLILGQICNGEPAAWIYNTLEDLVWAIENFLAKDGDLNHCAN